LGQGHIESVIDTRAGGRGDGVRPGQERQVGMKLRGILEDGGQPLGTKTRRDDAPPFRSYERVGDLHGEDVRSEKIMESPTEFIDESDGLGSIWLWQHGLDGHVAVEHLPHLSRSVSST